MILLLCYLPETWNVAARLLCSEYSEIVVRHPGGKVEIKGGVAQHHRGGEREVDRFRGFHVSLFQDL